MKASAAIALLQAQREFDVDMGGGRTVRLRRPVGTAMVGTKLQLVMSNLAGWDGYTEDFVLGNGVQSSQEFDATLAEAFLRDRPDDVVTLSKAMEAKVDAYLAEQEVARGNSKPS